MKTDSRTSPARAGAKWISLLCAASLVACNGVQAPIAPPSTSTTLDVRLPAAAADLSTVAVQPTFHVAPVLLEDPSDIDTAVNDASAHLPPHRAQVQAALAHLSTRGLTREAIESAAYGAPARAQVLSVDPLATPLSAGTAVATYTPAQIRAAYGLPSLPAAGAVISAGTAAQLGAGQTIYIVDASDNPNVAAELATFNQTFGLPGCVTTPVAPNASLPLPAATATGGCTLSVVYTTATGAMTATAPAYNSGWATEISLDVQWSHATAPLARIILLEAPDASVNSLIAAVNLANSMGPGIVSMSFGSPEGSWMAAVDGSFAAANMSYVASTGDSGVGVNWPSVSAHVLAVGATTLTYGGAARSEIAWSSTGGGVSAYNAAPAYQTSVVPGMGTASYRNVADVAFNGDPTTGQYVAVMSPGSTTVGWVSAGGTSLSAPQWAGLIAIANAARTQGGKAPLGAPHAILYGQVASVAASYAQSFADITQGSDGTCATCGAKPGYDDVTGLGTPNAGALLTLLEGGSAPVSAPVVAGGAVNGTTGTALSFSVAATAAHAVTYALTGAPSGMTISTGGTVTWPVPVASTSNVVVTATDTVTGLSGKGTYAVTITAPAAPVVTAATIAGTAGVALSYPLHITSPDPVTLTLAGGPAGLSLSATGVLGWTSPVLGTYTATVTARDSKTGLSGLGSVKLSIAAPSPPAVGSATVSGRVGSPLSFAVAVTATNPVSYALVAAPAGMTVSSAGVVSWPSPTAGSFAVKVTATDTRTGLAGQGTYTVTISPAGPVIKVTPITGVAGHAVSGTITVSDATSNKIGLSIAGVPMGMGFAISGTTITASWANPITGTYSLKITGTDGNGLVGTATLPITITAH